MTSKEAGLGLCALFLAPLVAGFYVAGPRWPQIAVVVALMVSTGWLLAVRVRSVDAAGPMVAAERALTAAAWWRGRQDAALGAMLVVTGYTFIQLSGALGVTLAPVIYALLLVLATFQARAVNLSMIALALGIEVAAAALGRGVGGGGWEVLALRCGFLAVFGAMHPALMWADAERRRRRTEGALARAQSEQREAARDYRLVATGKPGAGQVSREDAERMLGEDAVAAIGETNAAALRLLRASLGCHSAVLLWFDEEALRLRLRGADSACPELLAPTLQTGEGPLAGLLRRREPILLSHLPKDYEGLGYYKAPGVAVRQFIGVPVMERGGLWGVLCLDRVGQEPFGEADVQVAQRAAEAMVRALQTERLFLMIERSRRELDRFYGASRQLNQALTPQQVRAAALSCARDICDFDVAAFVTTAEEGGRQVFEIQHVAVGQPGAHAWAEALKGARFAPNSGLVSMAVEMQVALPHSGAYKAGQNVVFGADKPLKGMQSLLILPLVVHDQAQGALVLACAAQGAFTPERREVLEVVSNQVAISLQNAKMYEAMEMMATTDGLTGLTNHRTFKSSLDDVMARSDRGAGAFTLLLTDIDHFKSVNDTYGHPVGDEVLRQVAAVYRRLLRQTDLPARYGGEEFVVILEGTDLDGALLIAERLRVEVGALIFHTPERDFSVTMSVGVSEYPLDAEDKAQLIDTADQALYYAKTHGRNQVRAWRSVRRLAAEERG